MMGRAIRHFRITAPSTYLLVMLLFLLCAGLAGQAFQPRIEHITDERGESPSATFAIAEDSKGFIWLGTVDGLYRYDGYNFRELRNTEDNPNSLSNNTIRAMCISSDDRLYIGTQGGGLSIYDIRAERFSNFLHTGDTVGEISGNLVWSVCLDSKGYVWAGPEGDGVDRFDPATGTFTHFCLLEDDEIEETRLIFRSIREDSRGNIWIGTGLNGLYRLEPETGRYTHFEAIPGDPNSLPSNSLMEIIEDADGHIWVGMYGGGFARFDPRTERFERFMQEPGSSNTLLSNLVYHIVEKEPGVLWVSTEYGLSQYNTRTGTYLNFTNDQCDMNSLGDNRIRLVFVDSNGLNWIGSESGVDLMVEQSFFRLFSHDPGNRNSIPPGIVRSICLDSEGILWVGLIDNGLFRYNEKTGEVKHYRHEAGSRHQLPGNHITAIHEDQEGQLWFVEWDTGLLKYLRKQDRFVRMTGELAPGNYLGDTRIQAIVDPEPGILFLGAEWGIHILDTRTGVVRHMYHEPGNSNSLSANTVQSNAFRFDDQGRLWVGYWSAGLDRIEFRGENYTDPVFTHWGGESGNEHGLSSNNVISLCFTGENVVWVGTFGGGLNRLDQETGVIRNYSTDEGLPNNIVFSILEDQSGNLWLSTDKGLSKYSPEAGTFQNFYRIHGLQSDHFFWGSSFKSESGEIYFGGINGLNSFFPDSISFSARQTDPVIIDISVFNQPLETDVAIPYLEELHLPYDQNKISITYSALEYSNPGKVMYRYFLDGFEDTLSGSVQRRNAEYTNLKPGQYTFYLELENQLNNAFTGRELLSVTIAKPWWMTTLARAGFILLVLLMLTGLYYFRFAILERQKHKLAIQVKDRTAEITEKNEALELKNDEIMRQKNELADKNSELEAAFHQVESTQAKLIEAEKMASLGVMSAGIAHELNNPLNFISGGLEGMESYLSEHSGTLSEEQQLYFNAIKEGVKRVNSIVSSLNQFSRKGESKAEECDIHSIIENCLVLMQNEIRNRIEVTREFADEELVLTGNSGKLHQAILNLISNASHAIQGKGKIVIKTSQSDNTCEISITDNGMGISQKNLSRITEPFFTTKDPGKGTGLGLSITYNIIREHNGVLHFESEEGKGTTATITLPVASA